ncbi:MAG: DUF4920 domain-containing protein [Byssovorax sp.]
MRCSAVLALALALSATYALVGCAQPAPEAAAPAPTPSSGPQNGVRQATVTSLNPLPQSKFGAPITETNTTALSSLTSEPGKYSSKTVRTEGVVSAVCQSMGCWMEITDDSGQAHIKMAGHSFFIPKNASGHRAVVQGKLLNAAGPACASNDCNAGSTPNAGRGEQAQIEATGVMFLD